MHTYAHTVTHTQLYNYFIYNYSCNDISINKCVCSRLGIKVLVPALIPIKFCE